MLCAGLVLLMFAVAISGCVAPEATTPGDADGESRPIIILLMAEYLGPRIGAYGDEVAQTPNIDRLTREGVRFTQAFTTAGVCSPSRAAIITGIHQNVWGAGHMRAAGGGYAASPPVGVKAFPELLRAAGYYTVNDGKTDYQMGLRLGGASSSTQGICREVCIEARKMVRGVKGGIVYKATSFCLVLQYYDPKVLPRDTKKWSERLAEVQDGRCVHVLQQV